MKRKRSSPMKSTRSSTIVTANSQTLWRLVSILFAWFIHSILSVLSHVEFPTSALSTANTSSIIAQWRTQKIVYRRYAGLFFTLVVDTNENELACLEAIHLFVEVLDVYFGNVCELDLVFNFFKVCGMALFDTLWDVTWEKNEWKRSNEWLV